jgi:5'-3' exonuclease
MVKSLGNISPYKVMYIDAMNLITMSHYGMSTLSYKGVSTGMLHGVARLVLSWRQRCSGIEFVMVWEGYNSWRKEQYPIYKANRGKHTPDKADDFRKSVDVVKYALPYLGVNQVWSDTYEADDVVYNLAKLEDRKCIFSSGDWDWWELSQWGDILYRHKNVMGYDDLQAMFSKKYNCGSVPFDKLWLFKALTGDASDNVSGVPRFPKKLASKICNSNCTSISEVVSILEGMGETSWAGKVSSNMWILKRNDELLKSSIIPFENIERVDSDYTDNSIREVLEEYGMFSLIERFL